MPDAALPIIDFASRLIQKVERAVGHPPAEIDELAALAEDRGIRLLGDAASSPLDIACALPMPWRQGSMSLVTGDGEGEDAWRRATHALGSTSPRPPAR